MRPQQAAALASGVRPGSGIRSPPGPTASRSSRGRRRARTRSRGIPRRCRLSSFSASAMDRSLPSSRMAEEWMPAASPWRLRRTPATAAGAPGLAAQGVDVRELVAVIAERLDQRRGPRHRRECPPEMLGRLRLALRGGLEPREGGVVVHGRHGRGLRAVTASGVAGASAGHAVRARLEGRPHARHRGWACGRPAAPGGAVPPPGRADLRPRRACARRRAPIRGCERIARTSPGRTRRSDCRRVARPSGWLEGARSPRAGSEGRKVSPRSGVCVPARAGVASGP